MRSYALAFANPNLRRLQLSGVGSVLGYYAYGVALAVYAFEHGGAAAVGGVALARMLPSAVASPLAGAIGDRFDRRRVMIVADVGRAVAVLAMAALAGIGAPLAPLYVLTAVVAVVGRAFGPAMRALTPLLASEPAELTAANAASRAVLGTGVFLGPAVGGVILLVASPGAVFVVTGAGFALSAFFVARIRVAAAPPTRAASSVPLVGDVVTGLVTIARRRELRALACVESVRSLGAGALGVLLVVFALDVLDLGRSGVGYLNAALGVGSLLGALVALAATRRRLSVDIAAGMVLWGASLAVAGAWPRPAAAIVLLAVAGVGTTLVDLASMTLLQRAVPNAMLATVFGTLEGLLAVAAAVGALLAPVLVHGIGARAGLIVAGALVLAAAALLGRTLAAVDRAAPAPVRQLALLHAIPLFAPLDPQTLDWLGTRLQPLHVDSEVVVRQGDAGDRFFVVADGELVVEVDGRHVSTLGPGGYFGEVALLHDVPRAATVRALGPVDLYALERDDFIAAVTGSGPALAAAEAGIAAYGIPGFGR